MPRVCGVSGTTLAGEAVSVMSASKRMFRVDRAAASATQCGSKPVAVSGKREYSGICPETFGVFAAKVDKYGAWRPITNSQKPAIGGHLSDYLGWFLSPAG